MYTVLFRRRDVYKTLRGPQKGSCAETESLYSSPPCTGTLQQCATVMRTKRSVFSTQRPVH